MPFIAEKTKKRAILLALLGMTVCGCGGGSTPPPSDAERVEAATDELRQVVLEMELSPEDRVELLALLERYEQTTKEGIDLRQGYTQRWVELAQDYDATREQFDALLADQRSKRREMIGRLIALRVAAASHCTEEQWARLSRARSHRVDVQFDSLRHVQTPDEVESEVESEDEASAPDDDETEDSEGEEA